MFEMAIEKRDVQVRLGEGVYFLIDPNFPKIDAFAKVVPPTKVDLEILGFGRASVILTPINPLTQDKEDLGIENRYATIDPINLEVVMSGTNIDINPNTLPVSIGFEIPLPTDAYSADYIDRYS